MDGDGEWRQVKVCQCPGSGERESRAVCRDIAQIDEETNIGNNTQTGERTERDIAPGLQNQNSLHFLHHCQLFVFKDKHISLKLKECLLVYLF